MNIIALLLAGFVVGNAFHYTPGLMERVADNRQAWGQLTRRWDVDGYASTPDRANLGKLLYVRFADSPQVEVFQVVDYSNQKDLAHQQWLGLVAEFDYKTAVRHPALRLDGRIKVALLKLTNGYD